jgi:4-nitrophenyl phosphatase
VEVSPSEIITASIATIHYLHEKYPSGSRIYVIGEAPLKKMITDAGYVISEQDAAAVVATMDRALTYDMLKRGTLLIRAGAEYIGVNPDHSYPTPEGLVPGGGAILAALTVSTEQEPVVIGKPEGWIFKIAMERMGLSAAEVASLGDRLDTDISGGLRLGMKAILVLSGVTSPAELATSSIRPTWVFKDINELTTVLQSI